jgi:hypothetical protein
LSLCTGASACWTEVGCGSLVFVGFGFALVSGARVVGVALGGFVLSLGSLGSLGSLVFSVGVGVPGGDVCGGVVGSPGSSLGDGDGDAERPGACDDLPVPSRLRRPAASPGCAADR